MLNQQFLRFASQDISSSFETSLADVSIFPCSLLDFVTAGFRRTSRCLSFLPQDVIALRLAPDDKEPFAFWVRFDTIFVYRTSLLASFFVMASLSSSTSRII
uniref:Uncharacterized protein n=1 Tax=Cacopsylla melanoneura TaxID=428564 RepID=A0A8D8U066_9HEMI